MRLGLHFKHCDSGNACSPHQSPVALNAGMSSGLHREHCDSGTACSPHQSSCEPGLTVLGACVLSCLTDATAAGSGFAGSGFADRPASLEHAGAINTSVARNERIRKRCTMTNLFLASFSTMERRSRRSGRKRKRRASRRRLYSWKRNVSSGNEINPKQSANQTVDQRKSRSRSIETVDRCRFFKQCGLAILLRSKTPHFVLNRKTPSGTSKLGFVAVFVLGSRYARNAMSAMLPGEMPLGHGASGTSRQNVSPLHARAILYA